MIELAAMLAGGLGAAARFVVDGELRARVPAHLPIGTMAINLLGSFLLGALWGAYGHGHLASSLLLIAGTGFCGGFTTFSTASLDALRLVEQRRTGTAVAVMAGVAAACVALAALGWALG